MKKELQEKLFEKYPKIFGEKDLPMSQTCMCWGIDTGDGWYDLIDNLCGLLQGMTDNNPHSPDRFPQIVAVQVKEKYGTLRFYTRGDSDWQSGAIAFADYMSGSICDVCGGPGSCNQEGWISCRCEVHREQ